MSTVRLLLHVLLAGVHMFLTSLTILTENRSLIGTALLTLLGAWAGASSTLRTRQSLYLAAAGVGALLVLALHGSTFSFFMNAWILGVMIPLSICVWSIVAWRRVSEDPHPAHTLRATH